jgi:hypothetical protein
MAAGIGGVIGAPVTTFTSANTVDLDTTERICGFLVGHGVHGLALPLHTVNRPGPLSGSVGWPAAIDCTQASARPPGETCEALTP